ncbi:hypothetical protein FOZ60_013792 [Perkinsus olseni]|uniref:PUA domain-containing protein n=1 Tax=Perkinsus olseni TaxID=32597 RepID=A0A7J6P819_PEROL|nr:hypothetical protein FOZ60_013792 [Perkinsus olseni]
MSNPPTSCIADKQLGADMDEYKLVVIKVGTSTLMKPCQTVDMANMGGLVDLVASIQNIPHHNHRVIIVTSAAVGFGCLKLDLPARPDADDLSLKQAAAAVGQSYLIRLYEDFFSVHNLRCAQMLLSRPDFAAKDRYRNFRNAIFRLLDLGVVPIINENDCICVDELRFGENDTLSALVAVSCNADKLFLLTDVDCLELSSIELAKLDVDVAGDSQWGSGGMETKLMAARTAVSAGIECILTHGAKPEKVLEYLTDSAADSLMTIFRVSPDSMRFGVSEMTWRRRWILALPLKGTVTLTAVGANSIRNKRPLLATGICAVSGVFHRDEGVSLLDEETGEEIARALMNMKSVEIEKVKGYSANKFQKILGYPVASEVAFPREYHINDRGPSSAGQ